MERECAPSPNLSVEFVDDLCPPDFRRTFFTADFYVFWQTMGNDAGIVPYN